MSRCPHCQNTQGFVCGTCIECGWNHADNQFHWIKVWIEDLHPSHDAYWLTQKHADSSRRAEKETGPALQNEKCPRCGFVTANVFDCPTCKNPGAPYGIETQGT